MGFVAIAVYTCGLAPTVTAPQFILMEIDPGSILLKATGFGWSTIGYIIVAKLISGVQAWLLMMETFRMTVFFCMLAIIIPVMLNTVLTHINEHYKIRNIRNMNITASRTLNHMRMYIELEIVTQNVAQMQALASSTIMMAVFVVTVISNFLLARTSGVFPESISLLILGGTLSSMFSMFLSLLHSVHQ
jgi:hypothetical protein